MFCGSIGQGVWKMAHVAKYTASAAGHLMAHYERRQVEITGKDGMTRKEYIKFGNTDINLEKTHLNYNLGPAGSQLDILKKRLSEVRVLKRADVNVMCDWIVTLPAYRIQSETQLSEEEVEKLFFKRVYQFLTDRYGKRNVVSAYVHMDEITPHIHFSFVPVTEDKKRGGEKVSAKEVLTRTDLQTMHVDLENYLDSYRDIHFEILNGATRDGNRAIEELKRETAITRRNDLRAEITALEQKKDKILTSAEVEALKGKKTLLGGLKNVTYVEFEALKRTAAQVDTAVQEVKVANDRAERAEAYAQAKAQSILAAERASMYQEYQAKTATIRSEYNELLQENIALTKKINTLEKIVNYLEHIVKTKMPEILKTVDRRIKNIIHPENDIEL